MDEYPTGSLDHNVPLLVVSGLSTTPTKSLLTDAKLKAKSILIRSELPPVDSREGRSILHYIQETDATALPWNSWDASRKYKFKVKTIGRVCARSVQFLSWNHVSDRLLGVLVTTATRPTSRRL
jgi:hypothetical protein